MGVACECCVVNLSLCRGDHSSSGVLANVVCLGVILKSRQWGGPGPLGAVMLRKKKILSNKWMNEQRIVNWEVRGSVRGQFKVLWRNFPWWTEENRGDLRIFGDLPQIRTWKFPYWRQKFHRLSQYARYKPAELAICRKFN
jgi:hypothetical protein